MAHQRSKDENFWEVPYLPIDQSDVGRSYEDIIRINSQSGKGGVAYVLEEEYGYILPKAMHPIVGHLVQDATDKSGVEISKEKSYRELKRKVLLLLMLILPSMGRSIHLEATVMDLLMPVKKRL